MLPAPSGSAPQWAVVGSALPLPLCSPQAASKGLGLHLAAFSPPAETHRLCLEFTALNNLKHVKNKWLFVMRTVFFSLPFPVPYVGVLSLSAFCFAHQEQSMGHLFIDYLNFFSEREIASWKRFVFFHKPSLSFALIFFHS